MNNPKIILEAQNLHWITDPQATDLCAHGDVLFKIDDHIIVEPSSHDWCVSAAALYLLRTLSGDHTESNPVSEHLIPHCGHSMFKGEDLDVILFGCPTGINWEVIHDREKIILKFDDQTSITISRSEWSTLVCSFSDQIEEFYESSDTKQPYDQTEAEGYKAFRSEWMRRRREANQ